MTLTDLINDFRARTLAPTATVTDAIVTEWINQGFRTLQSMFDWSWMQDTEQVTSTAGSGSVALTKNWKRLTRVKEDGASFVLTWTPYDELLHRFPNDARKGRPSWWSMSGGKLWLGPVPDSARTYDIAGYAYQSDLSAGTDTPPFDAQQHHLLVDFAAARLWERDEDFHRAAYYMRQFDTQVASMLAAERAQGEQRPSILGERYGEQPGWGDDGLLSRIFDGSGFA